MRKIIFIFLLMHAITFCEFFLYDSPYFTEEEIEEIRNTPTMYTSIAEADEMDWRMKILNENSSVKNLCFPTTLGLFPKMQFRTGFKFGLVGYTELNYARKTKNIWKLKNYSSTGIELLDYTPKKDKELFVQTWKFLPIQLGLFELLFARPSGEEIRIEVEVQ